MLTEAEHQRLQGAQDQWVREHSYEPFPPEIAEWHRGLGSRVAEVVAAAKAAHPSFYVSPIDQAYGQDFAYFKRGDDQVVTYWGRFSIPRTMPIEQAAKRIQHHRPSEFTGPVAGPVPTTLYGFGD